MFLFVGMVYVDGQAPSAVIRSSDKNPAFRAHDWMFATNWGASS